MAVTSQPWPDLGASYDAVAGDYEQRFLGELAGKPRDRELLAAFLTALPPEGHVLDVGCGPGQIGAFVRGLRADGDPRPVVGVDLSAVMARSAAARLDAGVAADVLALPVRSGRAAGVVAFYSLIHLPRHALVAAVRELARVLAPGGRVLASFHEGEGEVRVDEFLGASVPFAAELYVLDEVVAAFEAGGLRVDVSERRPTYADEGGEFRLYVGATPAA